MWLRGALTVRTTPDQLFTGSIAAMEGILPPLQFSPHGPGMCHTQGDRCRDFPHSAQMVFWISPGSLGEFDITNRLTFSAPCER